MKKITSTLESRLIPKTSIFEDNKYKNTEKKDCKDDKKINKKNNTMKDGEETESIKQKKDNRNKNREDKETMKDNDLGKEVKTKNKIRSKTKGIDKNKSKPKDGIKVEDRNKSKDYNKDNQSTRKRHSDSINSSKCLKTDEKMKTPMSKIEKKILTHGTSKDKINVLTLQVERNPSVENYKNLLNFTENQRNDVIYETLKNLKDLLISSGECKDWYVKQRIVKTFEINLKNIFIKQKVLKLVFQLLKNNIYFLELIYPFLNKLGDKKELEEYVIEHSKFLFPIQENLILENLEDFYFKNQSFKARYSLLKLLGEMSPTDKVELYLKFGEALDLEMPLEHKMILMRLLLTGLVQSLEVVNESKNNNNVIDYKSGILIGSDKIVIKNNVKINNSVNINNIALSDKFIQILESAICPELALPIFKILSFTKPLCTKELLYKLLSHPPTEEFLKLVFKFILENEDKKLLKFIFNRSLLYKKEIVLAILYLINRNRVDLREYYGLRVLLHHYSLVVRNTVKKMIFNEEIREIKPFDIIDFEMHEEA